MTHTKPFLLFELSF